jgi:uncharacterized protein YgbK (DUF1537 family)
MLKALCLADDLTGALELGGQLGPPCVVSVDDHVRESTAVAVVNVATRHMSPAAAYDAVRRAVCDVPYIYLKTDSTLRGNIRESISALLDAFPDRELLYAPAYPAVGRTARDGCVYVNGIPVHKTSFAEDALNPVRSSSLRELLEGLARVTIYDGETESDLDRAAEHLRPGLLVAATAGFASRWIRRVRAAAGACVIAVGTRHPLSRAQAAGTPGVLLTPEAESGDPLEVGERFGREVARAAAERQAETLIIFGGDTALAVLRALGCRSARAIGELMPGVPRSEIEVDGRRLTLVTKAGGFGDEHTLSRILAMLRIEP